jgi:hypothetical protein
VWRAQRLNRLVVEQMLRDGHYDSAQALAVHHGLSELVEAELFVRMRELEEALLKRDPNPVLEWCKENSKTLGDAGKRLAFDLHQQTFVEVRLWPKRNWPPPTLCPSRNATTTLCQT